MTRDIGRPTRVLAVLDEGADETALRTAAALADRHGAALDAMACVSPPHDLDIVARVSGGEAERVLGRLVARLRESVEARLAAVVPERRIVPHVAVGKAFLEIIARVAATGADHVVKRAEPIGGLSRFLFASTDQHLLRKCPCPVWLQTPGAPAAPGRVLAAVDLDLSDAPEPETLDGLNLRVLEVARGLARGPAAEIVVLHAWEALGEGMVWAFGSDDDAHAAAERYVSEILASRRRAMDRLLARAGADGGTAGGAAGAAGPRFVPRFARGAPEAVIEAESRRASADVVVMGTVARTGLAGVFIGNTAENIINTLACPVVAVKPEGFRSPVL